MEQTSAAPSLAWQCGVKELHPARPAVSEKTTLLDGQRATFVAPALIAQKSLYSDPDLVREDFGAAWVYLIGPFAGAMIAVAFESVLKGPPTITGDDRGAGHAGER
jgi:hypothetical protein